jgi:hypothetical protein
LPEIGAEPITPPAIDVAVVVVEDVPETGADPITPLPLEAALELAVELVVEVAVELAAVDAVDGAVVADDELEVAVTLPVAWFVYAAKV